MKNIILIGLPGAGKSTLGVVLAKSLGMKFIDTDIVIQEMAGRILQEIINTDGCDFFLKTEEESILKLSPCNAVVATGGSVVYSDQAMKHLKMNGIFVYLNISYDEMIRRLNNINTRGIIRIPGQTLHDLYNQRIPLYEKYSDIRIDCSGDDFEHTVEKIIDGTLKLL